MTQRAVGKKGWGTRDTDTDVLVAVTNADTTADYLATKVVAGAGLTETVLNPGANEQLQLDVTSIPPSLQRQWIPAGAWEPLSGNTELVTTPIERVAADDAVWTTIKYAKATTDQWHFQVIPPAAWTSGKISFIVHYIIIDDIGTPLTIVWELGADFMADYHDIDAMAFQTVSVTDTLTLDNDPVYNISPQSTELTLTGTPAATGSINLRLKRGSDTESDPAYFVGMNLIYSD